MQIPPAIKAAAAVLRREVLRHWQLYAVALVLVSILAYATYVLVIPVAGFPRQELVILPADASSDAIGSLLVQEGIIRSPFYFKLLTRLTGEDRTLESGAYVFNRPAGLAEVAWRISHGAHGIQAVRVTLTEGMTVNDMNRAFTAAVPGFDAEGFNELASSSEGFLFPDTYFVFPGTPVEAVYLQLTERFVEQIASIQTEIDAFGKPLRDIVIMASILEREAQSPEDMQMVSGILWNRIRLGMPLQVDAVFGYIHDANGYTPTAQDLQSDSPYNTYRKTGLPPTPIANAGMNALRAAVTPTKTDNLYYLTGKDGKMHYAKTFEQHKANRLQYL